MRTVGEVVRWWLSRVEADTSKSASYRDSMASLMHRHVLPAVGRVSVRKLDRIALDDRLVYPMIAHKGLKARTAQKALQGLRQAFRMAADQGRIRDNPMAGMTLRDFYRGELAPKPAQLSRNDLPGLVTQLSDLFDADPAKGILPLMMLAHGTRIGETLLARWDHISLSEQVWVIPAGNVKSRREHVLPLTRQAMALLSRYRQSLPSARARSPWVFPVRGGGRLANTSAHALFREISQRQWSSHDLRKLMRSSLADIGVDYMVGEQLINHTLGITAETYLTRDAMERRREAMERWHARLDECGFVRAHGVKCAAHALPESDGATVNMPLTAESGFSTHRG